MRKQIAAANWKMNLTYQQGEQLLDDVLNAKIALKENQLAIFAVPFPYLIMANSEITEEKNYFVAAQNCYSKKSGAFTGEVSGAMLADVGCQYVLIGHSERRSLFHDDLALTALKFKAAQEAGLIPILCVGETQTQRENGETEKVVNAQLDAVLTLVGINAFKQAVIAYEPVWAIGTGLTATPEQAQVVHAYIRAQLMKNNVDIGRAIRILYGGSMKAENAASLLAMPDIDGGLIGGASLDATSFLAICTAAVNSK